MKYNFLHKSLSFLMAFVVLFSTLSFTVESHYCGDRLIDTAVFTKVEGCGMEMPDNNVITKSCCKNTIDVIKGQDELNSSNFKTLNLKQQQFVAVYLSTFISLFEDFKKQEKIYKEYKPPLLVFDIQLLDQTFLI